MTGLLVHDGRNAEAERAIGQAVEIVAEHDEGPTHILVYRIQCQLRMLNRDTAEAVEIGRRALALAERAGDAENVIAALNGVGSALLVSGNIDEGRRMLERSVALAERHSYDVLQWNALSNLGSALGEVHRFDEAQSYLERAIAFAEHRDIGTDYARSWLALVHCYRGGWDRAADLALQVLHYESSAVISRIMALIALGRIRARRGDPESGAALDEALRLAGPTATLQRLGPVHAARAEAAWLAGNPVGMAAEAQHPYQLALERNHAWFLGELAYWLWKADALDTVPECMAEPYARQIAGDWESAARQWDELGCPYEAARARAESSDPSVLTAALAELERLGTAPAVAMVKQRLRDLGVRTPHRGLRQSTRAHPARLTQREAECLELLSSGFRNAEIAERLFVSPKTVERHLTGLFAKLDVRSRTEALVEARRLGLLDQTEGVVNHN